MTNETTNILLVDDQPSRLLSYEVMLSDLGANLIKAESGNEALQRLMKDEFAVILSNAEGHESSGFTERLRGHLTAVGNMVEFTIGTATSPRDSTDPAELLRRGRL